mgnify:CR=1 FL=1
MLSELYPRGCSRQRRLLGPAGSVKCFHRLGGFCGQNNAFAPFLRSAFVDILRRQKYNKIAKNLIFCDPPVYADIFWSCWVQVIR